MIFKRVREYAFKRLCHRLYDIDVSRAKLTTVINRVDDFSKFFRYFERLLVDYPPELRKRVLSAGLRSYPSITVPVPLKLKLKFIGSWIRTVKVINRAGHSIGNRIRGMRFLNWSG